MGKLIPLVLVLIGLAVGGGAGLFLRPAPDPAAPASAAKTDPAAPEAAAASPQERPEYVKLNTQFIVPIVEGGRVTAMVIMALSLEVLPGSTGTIYAVEPKLRNALLQVMFDHANAGGFRGSFTDGANLILLRRALLEAAQTAVGPMILDVLIADIARQDS